MVSFIYKFFVALSETVDKFPQNQTVFIDSVFFIVRKSYLITRIIVDKSYLLFFTEKGLHIFSKAFIVNDPNWIKKFKYFVKSATVILLTSFFKGAYHVYSN